MNKNSILSKIINNVNSDGILDRTFSLKSDSPFIDGARDGILIYHVEGNALPTDNVVKRILKDVGEGKFDIAITGIEDYLKNEDSFLFKIDCLQDFISEHKELIAPDKLFHFAEILLNETENIEVVKFAMSLLELLDMEENENMVNKIKIFGLCNEFTLYSIFVLRRLNDGNEHIFDLAKRVHGWGRIHAIEFIEPLNEEIKNWLLMEGYKNDVLYEYSALSCAQKSDLLEHLKRNDYNDEEFRKAGEIISLLLNEGPVAGISGFKDAEELLQAYLTCCEDRKSDDIMENAKFDIEEYFDDHKSDGSGKNTDKMN